MAATRQTNFANPRIPYAHGSSVNVGGHRVTEADVQRGFIFHPAGRISLAGLRAQQEAANNAGEIDQQQAIRDAREALTKLPQYTQQGGEIISPERRQQRAATSQAGLAVLDVAGPLAEAGLLDNQQLAALLTKEVGASFGDQRQQRQITSELQAAAAQYRQGRLNEGSLKKFLDSMYAQYDQNLFLNPAYAQFTGIEEARKLAQNAAMLTYAAQTGYDKRFLAWDEKRNAPVVDDNAVLNEARMLDLDRMRNQPHMEHWQTTAKLLGPTLPRVDDYKDQFGNVRREEFEAAKTQALRDAFEYDQAIASPETFEAYMKKRMPSPKDTIADDLDSQISDLANSVVDQPPVQSAPVDPEVQYKKVMTDASAKEGVYIGLDGKRYLITRN